MIVKLEFMPSTMTFFWVGEKTSSGNVKMKRKNSNLPIYYCDEYSKIAEMLKMFTNIITMTGNWYVYNNIQYTYGKNTQECCQNSQSMVKYWMELLQLTFLANIFCLHFDFHHTTLIPNAVQFYSNFESQEP